MSADGDTDTVVDPDTYLTGVPHATFERLRNRAAVVWTAEPAVPPWPAGPGFWGVLRHAEIKEVMRDPATYSSYERATQIIDPPNDATLAFVRQMMLNQDPPAHSRLRRMLTRAFTPKAIARLTDRIEGWAGELTDRVAADGPCDFAELAADLPLRTLAEIFGVPQQDRWLMYDWSNRVIGYQDREYAVSARADAAGSTEMARRALALRPRPDERGVLPDQRTREGMPDLYAYAHDLAEHKRRHPGDDVLTNLVDEGITTAEFENMFWLFSVAGNETLRNALPGGMHALLSHVGEYRKLLRDRDKLPAAVDEMLRWWSPVMRFRRTAVRDTVLGGREIRAGDKVVAWFSSGNRDERVFADPDRFDVSRTDGDHLSFGHGPHTTAPRRLRAAARGRPVSARSLRKLREPVHRRAPREGADARVVRGGVRPVGRGGAGRRDGAAAVELPARREAPAGPVVTEKRRFPPGSKGKRRPAGRCEPQQPPQL